MNEHEPTITSTTWRIGPWTTSGRSDGPAPHRPAWQPRDEVPVALSVVWGDPERTVPVAVEDGDGCQALILGANPEPHQ